MKKVAVLFLVICSVALLSGCSLSETKREAEKPIEDAANYVPDMMGINQKAKNDINKAVGQENEKLKSALSEGEADNNQNNQTNNTMEMTQKYQFALLKTNFGEIKVKLDAKNAPKTAENFLKLANDKFYDGTKFHRVIKGFMIQGGDPLSKDDSMKERWGTGGPGYKFADELKGTEKYPQGTLAMANSGRNTNGSQFFIITADPGYPLQPQYTVFGQVVSGMDAALKIENVKTTGAPSDRPLENVVIESIMPLEK